MFLGNFEYFSKYFSNRLFFRSSILGIFSYLSDQILRIFEKSIRIPLKSLRSQRILEPVARPSFMLASLVKDLIPYFLMESHD